ncbi:MAG: HEPN domain-containing protein [Chloroflexota bacterium]
MSTADDVCRRWLALAAVDLAVAEENLEIGGSRSGIVCFHAQQAAEKTLEAALMYRGVEPPHRHNLNVIRNLLPGDWEIRWTGLDLSELTD